ncbi:hypothetical protein [Enterococcus dongliensis]|uniref:hypothetical protein n=1 Tax=Enterococcus dongliensis TaxID=2559925 RepID=UPI00288ECEC8|nr:hypothetical protein [Enterococcus dongliensis]MDT2710948.1 hypothetical protein [Enterococcus dongliensis]
MQTLYILFSFLTTLGIILMIYAFYRDFKNLTLLQKISLILVSFSGLVPMILGVIQGFLSH